MWHDGEIDMEELEARLYSQVYHPNGEEIPTSKPDIVQENLSANSHKRYFGDSGMHQPPYGSQNIHRVYQRHPNDNRTYFPAGENVEPALHYRNPANFYDQIGLFTYPAVNNIVVLPQPPTQIFTQHPSAERGMPSEKRKKSTVKRKERKRRAKEKWKAEKNQKVFKKHRLSTKNVNLENRNDANSSCKTSMDEIICLSESGSSDCEIEEPQVPSIVVSSEEEVDIEGLHPEGATEIKNETVTKISDGNEQLKPKETQALSGNNNIQLQNVQLEADDDDVVFIEPCHEILTICDESQSVTDANSSLTSNLAENNPLTLVNDTVLSKAHKELIDTPESTNDFLDNSFTSLHNSTDVTNNDSTQKLSVNDFESDSNLSVSDFDVPSRSAVFAEQEFDVPSKESFSELNLDSFTNYIASKASTSIPSILSPAKRSASNVLKNSKSKDAALRNSSDSSSESDYEDKVQLMKSSKSKRKINVVNEATSSESDDYIVNVDCDNIKSKTVLPNLSPITSDEETNCKVNKKSNKKKKQKKTAENPRTSGEKRKCVGNVEALAETKRSKQSEDADLNKPKRNDQQETHKFFSSSDSEIEVVRIDDKSPRAFVPNFDLELSNVRDSSTPVKQLGEGLTAKPKRFSDYWTEDMKEFYHESWGHEDFSVEEEQKTMSDDPVMWKIINNDEINFRLLPRGPRCFRCREFGHRSNNCRKKIGPPKCILCGASGHVDARCPNKMCTSCGRRSQYSTTYCSRCANSGHVMCKICRMRGHTSSYCTDLWRRYHLTTTDGPLKQPSDSSLKSSKDRWCSGCASHGHFEFNCNYYNRTHAPADPHIRSYEDVYERQGPREQTSNISSQSRGEGYYAHPNQVSPWIIGCQPNIYDQRFPQNFMQDPASNPNFYQQFPVFQSMPNLFGLQQNLNNIFYPNPELMSTNRGIQDAPAPNTSRAEASIPSLMDKIIPKPNEVEPQAPLEGSKRRDFLKLKNPNPQQLLSRNGLDFFKKLSFDLNVKIEIIKRKKKKKYSYWCMLEGAQELLPNVKESIKNHFRVELEATPIDAMATPNEKGFSMKMLRESVNKLENPNTEWLKMAMNLHQKIKELEKKLTVSNSVGDQLANTKALKSQYMALNAILLGKLDFARGVRHMKILKRAANGASLRVTEQRLKQAYNYVFRNDNRFNLDYKAAILNLSCNAGKKMAIDKLFQSGSSICKDNNMPKDLQRLKRLYKRVVAFKYSTNYANQFQKFYYKIKEDSKK